MNRTTVVSIWIAVALAVPSLVAAQPPAGPGAQPPVASEPLAAPRARVRHGVGIRTIVIAPSDAAPAVGGGVDWRIARGRFAAHLGLAAATSPAGKSYGFIRMEGVVSYDVGPIYVGAGLGAGTMGIETPGVGTGKWTGAGVAPFVQLGRELAIGRRAIVIELRGGASMPFGSIDPMEPVPSGQLEIALGVGVKL
jgi:hypothetical protein